MIPWKHCYPLRRGYLSEEDSLCAKVYLIIRSGFPRLKRQTLLNKNKEEIGIDGTKEIINNNNNSNLEIELNSIAKEILSNSGKNKLDDDLTVLTIGK